MLADLQRQIFEMGALVDAIRLHRIESNEPAGSTPEATAGSLTQGV